MHVAIIGSGQLARMLALAGLPLGLDFSFVVDQKGADTVCIDGLGTIVHLHSTSSGEELYKALGEPDVFTVEKEQVDITVLEALSEFCQLRPSLEAISACQNRQREKMLLQSLNIPTSTHIYIERPSDAAELATKLNYPAVLKSTEQGYDGKHQFVAQSAEELIRVVKTEAITPCIAEEWLTFDKEVSIVAVRSAQAQIDFYTTTENSHSKGILKQSIAPAKNLTDTQAHTVETYLKTIMNSLNYVGVMAMECFVIGDEIVVNELAPRVHNSGHWTQSGASTCQFENHIRAVSGLTLGSCEQIGVAGMVNLLGTISPPLQLMTENSTVHWYRKSARPGRKQGHVNFLDKDHESVSQAMQQLTDSLNSQL